MTVGILDNDPYDSPWRGAAARVDAQTNQAAAANQRAVAGSILPSQLDLPKLASSPQPFIRKATAAGAPGVPAPDNNITLSHAVSRLDTHVAWLQDLNERLGKALATMRGAQPNDGPPPGVIKDPAINHQMHGLLSEQSEQLEALGRRVDELTSLVGA